MSAVLDTNALIYDTFEDSAFHEEARSLLDELERWVVPAIVVYEYVWVLIELGVAVDDVAYKVREYVCSPKAELVFGGAAGILAALSMVERERLSLARFNDKVVLAVAKQRRCPLLTFDRRMRAQAARLGVDLLPKRYPATR
ncbi:MAG: PIN domain nuclease [Thermoprotei archaeon]|nr:MAG: PIN domain nuclease [Thermoprotei archaeon]